MSATKTTILLLLSVVFLFGSAASVLAQKKFSRSFPAGTAMRLQLTNRSGTITVVGWNRPEVSVVAMLEAPAANIVPQQVDGRIDIDLVRDNQGRDEVGNVNFTIRVPYNFTVSIETRIGNLNVTSLSGTFLRAHISTDGDIDLTNITSANVAADTITGNIFYDGEIQSGGTYRFTAVQGNINIRIPFTSSFKFQATAPSTRDISMGPFADTSMNSIGTGRRLIGKFRDGGATLTVTNQRGGIKFLPR